MSKDKGLSSELFVAALTVGGLSLLFLSIINNDWSGIVMGSLLLLPFIIYLLGSIGAYRHNKKIKEEEEDDDE